MKKIFQNKSLIFSILFLMLLSACHREKTDEELIFDLMGNIRTYAEKKDLDKIMMNLADDYLDFESRKKKDTRYMIEDYFRQYRGIAINVLSTRIDEVSPPEASIQTEVALSSGAAKLFRKLIRISLDNYRLKIKLSKKGGRWKIKYAEWKYVTLRELFPESLSIIKKLFPDM